MAKQFNKTQKEVLARKLGYEGPMNMFEQFVKSDPAMERKYNTVIEKFMARGGMVKKYQEGGAVTQTQAATSLSPEQQKVYKSIVRSFIDNASNTIENANSYLAGDPNNPERQAYAQQILKQFDQYKENAQKQLAGSNIKVGLPEELQTVASFNSTLGPEFRAQLVNAKRVSTELFNQAQKQAQTNNAGVAAIARQFPNQEDYLSPVDNIIFDRLSASNSSFANTFTPTPVPGATGLFGALNQPTTQQTTATTTATLPEVQGAGTTTPTNIVQETPTMLSPAEEEAARQRNLNTQTSTGSLDMAYFGPRVDNSAVQQQRETQARNLEQAAASGQPTTTATTTAPVGGATGASPGGVSTTVQSGPIPTTGTVPAVNIPQVTAATIPTEPGQMVSPTGAPEQAAQIQGAIVPGTAQVTPTAPQAAATMEAATATGAVSGELAGLQPAQGAVSQQAQVQAATMEPTSSALAGLQAAQTTAGQVQGAPTREVVAGELVEGPTVDRAAVEAALAKNEAAQGVVTEDMTVQGQLAKLTSNFEANNPPSWAAGALRNATAVMAQRGLAASSLGGQALIQATIESALPIASADAQIYREMGIQNLTNKQQMAVLSAQQRAAFLGQEFDQAFQTRVTNAATISEIANLNFSAKQQVALENARLAESVNLANLNNRQALVMANAAQIATLETANLNNRQQANVLNAQAFLQMDLTNLSNQQQTALFKSQSMIQSILSDQAAENSARQFNASSINQVNQFYDGLTAQIKQFNATQTNAMNQFNVSQINSVSEFNASQQNARDQFNAEYRRIIDQSNAEWRRNIALADTAAINRANEVNATAALGISTIEYNNLWQTYRDDIEYAWKTGENALDRENELARQVLAKQATIEAAKFQIEAAKYQALGSLAAQVFDKGGIAAGIGGIISAAAGTVAAGVSGVLSGISNAIGGSSSTYTVLPNTAKPGDAQYGWTYATDGTNKIDIGPDGSTFYNGVQQDYNYSYGDSGYGFDDNPYSTTGSMEGE